MKEDFMAFLRSRDETARAIRKARIEAHCFYCDLPMYEDEGVVPILRCPGCQREIPRV